MLWVGVIVVLAGSIHALAISNYGYHGDELNYLACTQHLDWGYVDHPPLAVWLLAAVRTLFGDSLLAIRAIPLLAGTAVIWLTGSMARAMGGGSFAALVAATAVLISGIHRALASFYSVNSLDVLWWAAAQLLLIRLINRERPLLWGALAIVMGLGLLTKLSMLWFGLGLAVAIVVSRERRWLSGRSPWLAALGAITLGLVPYALWQVANDWATVEWMARGSNADLRDAPLATFLGNQILATHPLNAPLWLGGLGCLLFAPVLRRYRLLGVQAAFVLILLAWMAPAIIHYPGPIYAVLFAAGAVVVERMTQNRVLRVSLRPALVVLMLLGGAVGLPMAIPILPEDEVAPYAVEIGITPPDPYGREASAFPQQLATMLGWPEIVAATARAWETLESDERAAVAIMGGSYSDAGAVDLFGPRFGLPRAISPHRGYWFWGPGNYDLETVLAVGFSSDWLGSLWEEVELVETVHCPRCEPWRRKIEIAVARRPRVPMPALWDELRHD